MNKQEKAELRKAAQKIASEANAQKEALRKEVQRKKREEKELRKNSQTANIPEKKKPKKIRKTVLDIVPVRQYKNDYFMLSDGTVMDIIQVMGKSYYNSTDADIAIQVDRLAYFFRVYKNDLKLVSLNYPTNTVTQQKFLNNMLSNPKLEPFYSLLMEKWNTLEYLEKHTTTREFFLFIYAENEEQYSVLKTLLFSKSSLNLMSISKEKKENILFLLNNMSKEINTNGGAQ